MLQANQDYVDMWPRSYAIGVFGSQRAEIHYNRLNNKLLDFELISGSRVSFNIKIFKEPVLQYHTVYDYMNVTHNWWGIGNEAEISQRIFDIDDRNTYTHAEFSPYYVSPEQFINFWWRDRGKHVSVSQILFYFFRVNWQMQRE